MCKFLGLILGLTRNQDNLSEQMTFALRGEEKAIGKLVRRVSRTKDRKMTVFLLPYIYTYMCMYI